MVGGVLLLGAACIALPALRQPPTGTVSVEVAQAEGRVCGRVVNGTEESLTYRHFALQLERQVGRRWSAEEQEAPVFGSDTFTVTREAREAMVRASLAPGAVVYDVLPHHANPVPPGRYRVCFRFRQGNHPTWQEECSAPFRLPP